MDVETLTKLLQQVADGSLPVGAAREKLAELPFTDLGYARVDHHRQLRQGMPEVVFGEGKTPEQLIGIVATLLVKGQSVLVTRVEADKAALVQAQVEGLTYNALARTLSRTVKKAAPRFDRPIAVVTAGTSDQSVAEEACETLLSAGEQVERIYDVGVAGIHRLFDALPKIVSAPAVICIAGMEGALPSVLGGLVKSPVVAVPTSVGYGTAMNGFTALFGMLTGCASGLTVVNIDNGFGAAMAVIRMGQLGGK